MSYSRNKILAGLGLESQTTSTDEVIYNDTPISTDEIEQSMSEITSAMSAIEDLEESTATLESYVSFMEKQLTYGGMNKHTTEGVYIGLESIISKYGLDDEFQFVSMEAVEEDQETATTGIIAKTAKVLGSIKDAIFGTILNALKGIVNLFKSCESLLKDLVASARSLSKNINQSNNGEGTVKVGNKAALAYHSGDLEPDQVMKFFSEDIKNHKLFFKNLDVRTTVSFIKDAMSCIAEDKQPADPNGLANMYNQLSSFTQADSMDPLYSVQTSPAFLGAWKLKVVQPSEKLIKEIQEGKTEDILVRYYKERNLARKIAKILLGALPPVVMYDIWVRKRDVYEQLGGAGFFLQVLQTVGAWTPQGIGIKHAQNIQDVKDDVDFGVGKLSGVSFYAASTLVFVDREEKHKVGTCERMNAQQVKEACDLLISLENINMNFNEFNNRYWEISQILVTYQNKISKGLSEDTAKAIAAMREAVNGLLIHNAYSQCEYSRNVLMTARALFDYAKASNGKK